MTKHVLALPSFLDCQWSEGGSFFIEQAEIMRRFAGWEINMLIPCARHALQVRRRGWAKMRGVEIKNKEGVEIWVGYYPYWLPRKKLRAWCEFGEKLFLQYVAKHGKPDYLWAQVIPNAGYLALHLHHKYGVPYFVHEHVRMYAQEKLPHNIIRRIKHVIDAAVYCAAVGEKMRLAMLRQVPVPAEKIAVIHNPLGMEFANVGSRIAHDDFVFVSTAWLRADKNVAVIIRALAILYRQNQHVRLLVAGAGSEEEKLKQLVGELSLQQVVSFVGKQNRQQICELLLCADAWVAASDYENCSVALLEALACGLPAVTTRVGIAEQIVNESNGVLVDSVSVEEVARAMEKVAAGQYHHEQIKTRALEKFHPQIFADRMQEKLNFK